MADPLVDIVQSSPYTPENPLRIEIRGTSTSSVDPLVDLVAPVGTHEEEAAPPVNPNYQRGQDAPGWFRGLTSVANGPTFGFGDEILGAVGGAYKTLTDTSPSSFEENYRAARDYVRGAQDFEKKNSPWTTGITQTMASAPLMAYLPVERAVAAVAPKVAPWMMGLGAKPIGIVQQTARAAGSGAVNGAVSGLGNSTAELLDGDIGGAATDTLKGAATGTVLSGAAVPVFKAGGAVIGNVASRVNETQAMQQARAKVAEMLARDAQGSVFTSGADNPIFQVGARFNSLQRNGAPAVIADAGGENTRQLLDTLATLPGQTKNAAANLIRDRQATSATRMINAAENGLGTQGDRLAPTLASLTDAQQRAAAPLYAQVNAISIGQPSSRLQQIVAAADQLGASSEARKIATAELTPYSLDLSNPSNWRMTDLDRLKRGLDTLIAGQFDAKANKFTSVGSALISLSKELRKELDQATTDPRTGASVYAAARNAFAGPEALKDAALSGQRVVSMPEAKIRDAIEGMSTSELMAFRVGAFEALRTKMGSSLGGRTEIMNMWQNPALADKLKVLFGSERGFREFAADVARERTLKLLNSTGKGSQTASRQYGVGDLDSEALSSLAGAAASASQGHTAGVVAGLKNAWNRVQTPEPVRDAMGQILLSGGPQGVANLNSMTTITQRINQDRARLAAQMGLLFTQPQVQQAPLGIIGSGLLN